MEKSGCPVCSRSKGELKIESFLLEKSILFKPEYKFTDCRDINPLPFDFYLPELNTCIEYDEIKNEYCREKCIKLIRIKYTSDVESILQAFSD